MLLLPFLLLASPSRWTIASADTRLTLAIRGDREVIEQLAGVDGNATWCRDSPVPLIDQLSIGGKVIPAGWRFVSAVATRRSITCHFRAGAADVELDSTWQAATGHGPIEHAINFVNHTSSPVVVSAQDSLALTNVSSGSKASVWWTQRGASNALTEGGVFSQPVTDGLDISLQSNHHIPYSPVPWMAVQSASGGLYVGWEFSGLGRVAAKVEHGQPLAVNVGLLPNFRTDVGPGESLSIPTAFVGCYKGDLDDGSWCLHQFVLHHLRASVPRDFEDPALLLNLYLDAGADHAKEADVLRCEKFTKDLGIEVFMPDAMWFPACGDWRWDPARFPDGISPIEKATHGDGLKLGLWCAWNNGGISPDPGALNVHVHPDWFQRDMPADWKPGPFYGVSADMGDAEAKAWAIAKTQQMVGDWKIDVLKTDVDPMINDCTRTDHRHHFGTDVSYWSALGVYEVWDKLRARFPKLVLENCSGASHIKDFGVIKRSAYTTTTDTLSNLPDRCGIYDSTYVLPPSALLTYTYENGYGLPGDDPGSYLARSAMMTAWSMDPTNSAGWTPEMRAAIKSSVQTYKAFVRPILRDCKVHHVLPRPDGKHWDGMFFWSTKLCEGALFVFRPDAADDSQVVRLAGLESGVNYAVSSEDGSLKPFRASGKDLMDKGLTLRLPNRFSSDLIHIRKAERPSSDYKLPSEVPEMRAASTGDIYGTTSTVDWMPVAAARSYRLVVSAHADLSSPIVDKVLYAPHWSGANLPSGARMYVSIEPLNWGGAGPAHMTKLVVADPQPWGGEFVSRMAWVSSRVGVPEGAHRDVNHYGNPLAINGKVYARGIWTHSFNDGSPADIVISLEGKEFGMFASDVGLDDASGGGSVQFQVWADGVLLAETPILHPREIVHLKVDIRLAKLLTLRVLNGGDGYNSDHAVWGSARLIRVGQDDPLAGR